MNILYITGCTSVFKSWEDLKLKYELERPIAPSVSISHILHMHIYTTHSS